MNVTRTLSCRFTDIRKLQLFVWWRASKHVYCMSKQTCRRLKLHISKPNVTSATAGKVAGNNRIKKVRVLQVMIYLCQAATNKWMSWNIHKTDTLLCCGSSSAGSLTVFWVEVKLMRPTSFRLDVLTRLFVSSGAKWARLPHNHSLCNYFTVDFRNFSNAIFSENQCKFL